MDNLKIIITGAPGTGKTSLINSLMSEGFCCYPEISRQVIKEQQDKGETIFPWKDLLQFAEMVHLYSIRQYQSAFGLCFFDRGLPDIIAYLDIKNKPVAKKYYFSIEKYLKNAMVFITVPWKEIFVQDKQRQETFDDALKIHSQLIKTYKNLDFRLNYLGKESIKQRKQKVVSEIELKDWH